MARRLLTGNEAQAWAVKLCRVDYIGMYPITPQTLIVEKIAEMIARDQFNAIGVCHGGEHGMVGGVLGASLSGGRVFTATSSLGGLYAMEMIHRVADARAPIGMGLVNRCNTIWNIFAEHEDTHLIRDLRWLIAHVGNVQEVLDFTIIGYMTAEDKHVLLPFMVCQEGFDLSFTAEGVHLPKQSEVDELLGPYSHPHLNIEKPRPVSISTLYSAPMCAELRRDQGIAMKNALKVLERAQRKFERVTGRGYGALSSYGCEDADIILFGAGTTMRTARHTLKRRHGGKYKVGLVELQWYRPFPQEQLKQLCKNAQLIGVIDRNFTGQYGVLFEELKAALYDLEERPRVVDFLTGMGGMTVTSREIDQIIKKASLALEGRIDEEIVWIGFDGIENPPDTSYHLGGERAISKGTPACGGCTSILAVRHIIEEARALFNNIYIVIPAGCMSILSSGGADRMSYKTQFQTLNATLIHANFASAPSVATGLSRMLRRRGIKEPVIVLAGDGATVDIGFGGLSSAAERNEDFIYICYDNEAYMNTGIQRSGSTPYGTWTTTTPGGKVVHKKPVPLIMLKHNIPYVATASVAYIGDLRKKVRKALEMEGFRYLHILTPCPRGWRFNPAKAIEMARLAESAGIFPRWEYERGNLRIDSEGGANRAQIESYLKAQGRFSYSPELLEKTERYVEKEWWNLRMARASSREPKLMKKFIELTERYSGRPEMESLDRLLESF